MREIKFRAWDCTIKQYIYVAFIDLVNSEVSGLPFEIQEGQDEIKIPTLETIEQFTGLRDKNEKDIYEGDIVRSAVLLSGEMVNNMVRWIDCGFIANGLLCSREAENCEVIGNIHENPELLSVN